MAPTTMVKAMVEAKSTCCVKQQASKIIRDKARSFCYARLRTGNGAG